MKGEKLRPESDFLISISRRRTLNFETARTNVAGGSSINGDHLIHLKYLTLFILCDGSPILYGMSLEPPDHEGARQVGDSLRGFDEDRQVTQSSCGASSSFQMPVRCMYLVHTFVEICGY